MKNKKTILEEFQKMGDTHAFFNHSVPRPVPHLGSILEVRDNHILYEAAPGPWWDASEITSELIIPFTTIDFNSLSYWDKEENCFMDVLWDEETGQWKRTRYEPKYPPPSGCRDRR